MRPPLQGYKCQGYRHIAAVCWGKRRCGKCGGEPELTAYMEAELKCGSCGGKHLAVNVQKVRDNCGILYAEAARWVGGGGRNKERIWRGFTTKLTQWSRIWLAVRLRNQKAA